MGDSSTENNEFQFYLLLVRQYIFQLPEEDERVRAAAWMVHLRRLRDAKDLKLRNDYIKLLLFAMHSRCLIGPFAQPPQKDKGLEHFPKNFTFPEMMRHLIEESKSQSIRNCQSKHRDQLPFTSGEYRVQEKLEDTVALPAVSLTQTQTYRRNFDDSIRPTECKEGIVSETMASWVNSDSSKVSPDVKVEHLTKLMDENRKEYQSIREDAPEKIEGGMKSALDAHQEPQLMQDTAVPLHHIHEQININHNSLICEENNNRDERICNGELYNNKTLRNSSQFTGTLKTNVQSELNRDHSVEKNVNNEMFSPFKYSDQSHYQHCYHHHHHKSPIFHSNGQHVSALEMEVTGRKYIGQVPPQIPLNGGMTTHAKHDFSVNCGHSCFSTDFRETRRKQENNTCWLKENFYNNLGTNPLIHYQTDYDSHTTNLSNHQAQENCSSSHTMSNVTDNTHNCPLDINNRKCNDKSSSEIKERSIHSDEAVQKNNEKQCYILGNGVNTKDISERQKLVMYDSERIHAHNIKDHRQEEGPKTQIEEPLFPASALQLPLNAINELSINEVGTGHRKSAQEMHRQGSSKQMHHIQTETQENMSSNRRHTQSTEDILSGMSVNAKCSEFNVAKFRASLSADLGAYSAGYAAGYSAGYAAGITTALHSSAEQLHTVLQ